MKMNIVLAFPQQDKETGVWIKTAFEELNCNVTVLDTKVEPGRLYQLVCQVNPDYIFCSRTPELLGQITQIKNKFPNIPVGCWNVDVRYSVQQFGDTLLNLFRKVDILYTIGKGNIKEYQRVCQSTIIQHLQEGCDPATHKIEVLTKEDHQCYDCDVMFAGSYLSQLHADRALLIRSLRQQDFSLKLYGYKTRIAASDQNKANLCSKIVLGHSGWPKLSISMSARDYRVMASGGFLLTNYCPGMEDWFSIGKECDVYRSIPECIDKIRYYLEHENERINIARNGYQTTQEKHKFVDRIRIVLDDAKRIIQTNKKG